MKKLLLASLVLIIACVMTGCGALGNGPKATVEKYAAAIIQGDYRAALDLVYFKGTPEEAEKTREQFASLCEEKTKKGLKDSDTMTKCEILDEQVDKENGVATVTAKLTYADGHEKTDDIKLVKGDDGNWLIDNNK